MRWQAACLVGLLGLCAVPMVQAQPPRDGDRLAEMQRLKAELGRIRDDMARLEARLKELSTPARQEASGKGKDARPETAKPKEKADRDARPADRFRPGPGFRRFGTWGWGLPPWGQGGWRPFGPMGGWPRPFPPGARGVMRPFGGFPARPARPPEEADKRIERIADQLERLAQELRRR